ncbi:MAG: PKD domain-containing protein [Rhodospirillales bacterium]|nr:MAG: PKD domain-containing protein [Rhodospirillales bacterium]
MRRLFILAPLALIWAMAGAVPEAAAYSRYNDGCQVCHGAFTDSTSPKGSVFPGDDKHNMHRSSSEMGTNCNLCHTSGDGRNPFIGSSDGTAANAGVGCVGCHGRELDAGNDGASPGRGAGLRQHHFNSAVTSCANCHSDANPANYTPVGENEMPQYYGTADTNANGPCNEVATSGVNENWTVGDLEGLDNDGDGLYDGADPDCAANTPPVADANGPYSGTVDVPVAFDGSASNDPDGTIVSYDWVFGDGGTGTGVNPTYTYAASGVFSVTLTVTDDGGLTGTDTTTATIVEPTNLPPVADPNGPYSGTVGVPVAFDGSGSTDPDGTIVSYDWDYGDGTVVLDAGPTPSHAYAAPGLYGVVLTVTDDLGATDTASTTADITEPGVLDLDIAQFSVTKRVSASRPKPIGIKLVVKNNGTVEGSATATITGVQDGVIVYSETLQVTDPIGNGRTRYDDSSIPPVPPYLPVAAGDILWTATIADDDADIDEATAVTRVVP